MFWAQDTPPRVNSCAGFERTCAHSALSEEMRGDGRAEGDHKMLEDGAEDEVQPCHPRCIDAVSSGALCTALAHPGHASCVNTEHDVSSHAPLTPVHV